MPTGHQAPPVPPVRHLHHWHQEGTSITGTRKAPPTLEPGRHLHHWHQGGTSTTGTRKAPPPLAPGRHLHHWHQGGTSTTGTRKAHPPLEPWRNIHHWHKEGDHDGAPGRRSRRGTRKEITPGTMENSTTGTRKTALYIIMYNNILFVNKCKETYVFCIKTLNNNIYI